METQEDQIFVHLLAGRTLTPAVARELFDCDRLAARICDLRKVIDIRTEIVKTRRGKRVASYRLSGVTRRNTA